MKVLHIIARLNVGGTARYIEQVVKQTAILGIDSRVLTGSVQGAEVEDPCVASLPVMRAAHLGRAIKPVADWVATKEIAQAIRAEKPDVIHTHTFKAGALARIVNSDVPLVHTFHGHLLDDPEFQGLKKNVIVAAERALAPRAQRRVTVGERVAQDLLTRGVGRSQQYLSIPPGVVPLEQLDRDHAREELGLNPHAQVVAWVARVTGVKAPQRVIDIAKAMPDVTFVMAGGGDMQDWMRTHAPENLKVIGWQRANVVFSAADVVLSTSENEGMPVALIEAQMMGLPVVATDVGAVGEVVIDGHTGYVGSPQSLETNLKALMSDEQRRHSFAVNARERSRIHFSVEALGTRHADLYRSMVSVRQ